VQGINGVHIKLDDRSQAYILNPDLIIPPPARDVVLCLCELGWLYGRVVAYLKSLEKEEIKGLIAQAFGHTLQHSLHDYYRLLAVLEQELSRSQHPAATAIGPSDESSGSGTTGLSLIRLRVWMQEPLERSPSPSPLLLPSLPLPSSPPSLLTRL
jgi:gamma-tubulin complex component 3